MVRKGLSAEEKREKILGIYHSTKAVFNLKEIEKAASKLGVVSQTVKVYHVTEQAQSTDTVQ